jgi:hypothetical protein
MISRRFAPTIGCLTALALLLRAGPVKAEFIQNSTGIAHPVQTITFDEHVFPMFTTITDQYADLGVTFSPFLHYSPQQPTWFPHIDDTNLGNFYFFMTEPPFFSIHFIEPRAEAAFAMITNPGRSIFTALRDGVVLESTSAPTNVTLDDNFYGFTGIEFDEIEVHPGGSNATMLLDNLQLGLVVPEPAGLSLTGVGILGLLGWGWRCRA